MQATESKIAGLSQDLTGSFEVTINRDLHNILKATVGFFELRRGNLRFQNEHLKFALQYLW